MTTSATLEPMSAVDRAWLEMDHARNPMIVAGILQLSDVAAPMRWSREIVRRLMRYPRFCQRADESRQPPMWVPDKPDPGYHVHLRRLPRSGGELALREAIATELGAELDRARPLWRITLFPQPGKRLTVLFRAHHALADGIALVRVLMNCTDAAMRDGVSFLEPAIAPRHDGPIGGLIDRLEAANRVLGDLEDLVLDDLRHPQQIPAQLRAAQRTLNAVRRVFALPQDNPAAMRKPLSGHRRIAWASGLPFGEVRELAQRLGVKVNDVFMALLAGALGDVLRADGVDMPESQNLRVSIPVNLRAENDAGLGNGFGLVLLDLPIAMQDPLRCVEIVASRMAALKASPEAKAVLGSLAIAGHLPVSWEKKLVNVVAGKAAAVVSNLPGPKAHVKIGGARLDDLVFWPPQAGEIGLGISFFSYAGGFSLGVSADAERFAEPQLLLDAFAAALAELKRLAASDQVEPAARRVPALPSSRVGPQAGSNLRSS
jgi:diacylglycerol O-acyltransferase